MKLITMIISFVARSLWYCPIEPIVIILVRILLTIRYAVAFLMIGSGIFAWNYPDKAKEIVVSLIPKVSIEKPDVLK